MTTAQSLKSRVLAYMKNHWFASEQAIADFLQADILDVLEAMIELEASDPDVVVRDGLIGYIGSTDREN